MIKPLATQGALQEVGQRQAGIRPVFLVFLARKRSFLPPAGGRVAN